MKYTPIATKHNNRFRGPIESHKDVAFSSDIIYNINQLKGIYANFENELKKVNDKIKTNKGVYIELRHELTKIENSVIESNNLLNNI